MTNKEKYKKAFSAIHTSDKEGDFNQQGGGGITFVTDGTELPASEEDLIKHLTAPDVEYKVDGSVWVYWFDQKIDITEKFSFSL